MLFPRSPQAFDLVSEGWLHRDFPFDSGIFDFDLTVAPALDLKVFRITNRVPGFVCDCDDVVVSRNQNGAYHFKFVLERAPVIRGFVLLVAAAALVFAIAIVRLERGEGLATAIASYFISLWSLRAIVGDAIKTFPTLFDLWILLIAMWLAIILSYRLVVGTLRRGGSLSSNRKIP